MPIPTPFHDKTADSYDAVIIGGGHNGLVTAAYLARAGWRVLVLEQRHLLGGATVTEEVYPGFKYSVFSYVVSLLRPEIIRELDLPRHGLTVLPLDSTLTPLPNGDRLYRDGDPRRTRADIARFSTRDADAYADYGQVMVEMAKAVQPLLAMTPPNPKSLHPRDLWSLLRLARHFRGLPDKQLHTLVKLLSMPAADFVGQWFQSEPLMGTLSASGIIGTFLGPRSPGTAYVLLHHYMGELDGQYRAWGFAKGGTGGIASAIANAARSFGAEIRTEAQVAQVIVENGQVRGVALSNGDELRASVVASSLDPKQTFLRLVDSRLLPADLLDGVRSFNIRGSSAKVNLALDAAPELLCLRNEPAELRQAALRGAISISPSVDYIERAYDDAKYGRFSRRPYVDIILPSMIDPDMAPPGKHVMSCFVQYAPYDLAEGSWPEQREALGDAVIDTLSEYMPNLKDIILHRQVMTPWDIEQVTGLTQGNIFQGELSLSQLFFLRPVPGYAQYRTPIHGYYQCGSGAHPGGGITGAPGRLAAREILRDAGRKHKN